MHKTKIKSLAFSVDPSIIVEQARSLVLCGHWIKGYELLKNSVIGLDYEYAEAILSGNGTLIEENGTTAFESTSDEEYNAVVFEQEQIFSKFYIESGQCYKPLCHIVGLNPQDGEYAYGIYGHELPTINKPDEAVLDSRMEFYVDKQFHDISKPVTGGFENKFIGVWTVPSSHQLPPWLDREKLKKDFFNLVGNGNTFSRLITLDDMRETRSYWFDLVSSKSGAPTREQSRPNTKEPEKPVLPDYVELGKQVWDVNGSEYVTISGFKVALKPLLAWASTVTQRKVADVNWNPLSPQHWKTINDNPTHTDWVLSAGIDPSLFYEKYSELNKEAYSVAMNCCKTSQHKEQFIELTPLVIYRESDLNGIIQFMNSPTEQLVSDIVVIPDCSIKWRKIAEGVGKRGGVVISFAGGELSHLVMESDDIGATIYLADKKLSNSVENFSNVTVGFESQGLHIN
ncbi:hypothetical protein [Vibrio sp. D431a]|uniref:hypothetical protein n=1 Tax=Vibrio sp. D431a TaxID=2837388 RepID=UPI0025562F4C|nr:hypothetical protein [Vibrio sp. D431a]MDK9790073.1 hypothetical protein [Vibrio sp. D431a]